MLTTIKLGDSGNLVKVAEYLTGYAKMNNAAGIFDESLQSHIINYQTNNGLSADGIIGSNTWSVMAAKALTCSTSKNKKSEYTCAVQILIGGLTVDGIYGTNTKKAVAAYQSASGLSADGICGPKTWASLICGSAISPVISGGTGTGAGQTVSGDKILNKCVHYLQWDSKWKSVKYSTHTSSQTIGNSGCGPSSMAMIMATFIDKTITPVEMCALAVKGGYRTYDNGTDWGFYEYVYKKYSGFSKFIQTGSIETLKAGLKEGALAVCSMNANDNNFWTKGGHFIVAIGYDSTYIYANDPNKSEVPRKQAQSKFKSCMKQAFLFWPTVKESEPELEPDKKIEVPVETPEKTEIVKRGDKIVDISKHQPTVDYDKLIADTALIILRAGYRGTGGSVKIDECFEKHASALKQRGVPFGVYFYSIATTEAKAKEEATMFWKYAKDYKPLFWAMDAEQNSITKATIMAFVDSLRALGAERVGCYLAHELYLKYDYDSIQSKFDFTWIPRYGSNDGTTSGSIKPKYTCDLWQYTSKGRVNGISGDVDLDIITGQGKTLLWFLDEGAVEEIDDISKIDTWKNNIVVATGDVYIRTAPNTSGKILGVLYNGNYLPYQGEDSENGWHLVIFDNQNGWVSGKYSVVQNPL